MWQAMLHNQPNAIAEYEFVCRSTPEYPLSELKDALNKELDHLCSLSFQPAELSYLSENTLLSEDFIDFLSTFKFERKYIKVSKRKGQLIIKAKGPQIKVMGFEIFCLYIVEELYFQRFDTEALMEESRKRLKDKIQLLKEYTPKTKHPFMFFDFGLRRRWSSEWQDEMVRTLANEVPEYFKGTSNVYLAMKYGLKPIGTFAHEFVQSYQATSENLIDFQKNALEDWAKEFNGDLTIALTDTICMDAFLNDFNYELSLLYQGMRHDSGCPYEWGNKALTHYSKMNIDANEKLLVFSDGLDIQKALDLHDYFGDNIKTGSGIGTNLSNDTGMKPLNIVMKLMKLNGKAVAKLSDAPGKTLCKDKKFIASLIELFNYNVGTVA